MPIVSIGLRQAVESGSAVAGAGETITVLFGDITLVFSFTAVTPVPDAAMDNNIATISFPEECRFGASWSGDLTVGEVAYRIAVSAHSHGDNPTKPHNITYTISHAA